MSFIQNLSKAVSVHKRKVMFVGGIGGLLAIQAYTGYNPLASVLRTPAVQNIENRYSSGGATKDHTPGAATARGSYDKTEGNVAKETGSGTDRFKEKVGEQRPDPGPVSKAFNKTYQGQERGK